jgi:hypothetical protein
LPRRTTQPADSSQGQIEELRRWKSTPTSALTGSIPIHIIDRHLHWPGFIKIKAPIKIEETAKIDSLFLINHIIYGILLHFFHINGFFLIFLRKRVDYFKIIHIIAEICIYMQITDLNQII